MIVDTNALSAFFDGVSSVTQHLRTASGVYLPVIVIGEYRFGLRRSRLRSSRESLLAEFIDACAVLTINETTTHAYAAIRHELRQAGTPIPENDIWISALAIEHGLPLLTADRHFDQVKRLQRIGWD